MGAVVCVCVALAARPGECQLGSWPQVLAVPAPAPEPDSNATAYGSDQSLYIHTFKSKDSLCIMSNDAVWGVNQNVDYALTNDSRFNTKDQFYDLSGGFVRKGLPLGLSAGLEWAPVLIVNKRTSREGGLGSIEAGPVVSANPWGIPVFIHGGGTARGWTDSVGVVSMSRYDSLSRDKGFYVGADIGSQVKPLPFLPLIVNVRGYGRSMGTSKLVSGTGFALLYLRLPTGDSCFALYADSLTNGRDAFLGQDQGKPHFINDPDKTERSYQVTAGIRGHPRLFVVPGVVYSYNERTLSYHDVWGDKKNTDHSVYFMLATDSLFPVAYSGGIKIDWEREDKHSLSFDAGGGTEPLSPQLSILNLEGKLASLDDYRAFRVQMVHSLQKYFKNGMGAEYTFDISRYSKDYPVFYVSGRDTIRPDPPLDNDIIINRQKLTLVPIPASWGKASLFGEYSRNHTNYLKRKMSGNNAVDQLYRVGGNLGFVVAKRCTLSEAMSADAKVTEYVFPEVKRGSPPPYSRKWVSQLLLGLSATGWLTAAAEWKETYCDFGTWNAREYLDSTALAEMADPSAYRDYYAIRDKSWEHDLKLTLAATVPDVGQITAGCSYQYLDFREFDVTSRTYAPLSTAGTRVTPFASVSYQLDKRLQFFAGFAKTFDIHENYWDIHVSLSGVF
jgi:hypothetical protein